jgi:hypothetical protein
LLEIVQSWHLFDERQLTFSCSSVFRSNGTAQKHLLPIILEASSSKIHNLISSIWHTGLDNNVLSKLCKLSKQKRKYLDRSSRHWQFLCVFLAVRIVNRQSRLWWLSFSVLLYLAGVGFDLSVDSMSCFSSRLALHTDVLLQFFAA